MPLRLEAFHDPLSPPDWFMGILRPIVQAFMERCSTPGIISRFAASYGRSLSVINTRGARPWPSGACAAGAWPLSNAAALHENVQDEAVLICGAPQPMLLARAEMTASSRCHLSPSCLLNAGGSRCQKYGRISPPTIGTSDARQ